MVFHIFVLTLYSCVDLQAVVFQKLLNNLVALELVLSETQDFESLLTRHESSFDSQALLSYILPALVSIFLLEVLLLLLNQELVDFLGSLHVGERSYISFKFFVGS